MRGSSEGPTGAHLRRHHGGTKLMGILGGRWTLAVPGNGARWATTCSGCTPNPVAPSNISHPQWSQAGQEVFVLRLDVGHRKKDSLRALHLIFAWRGHRGRLWGHKGAPWLGEPGLGDRGPGVCHGGLSGPWVPGSGQRDFPEALPALSSCDFILWVARAMG